jgi:YidC/Oxa1 family membrane protein insertase
LLNPLYIAVSWVLLRWHELFSWLGMNPDSGLNWALSIVFLVITIRILLFRFFIKQVHSQRKMQEVQPKIAALREKYKNDRQTLSQEMMKLQKEEGFNPIGGCLPILLQAPVFIALFHVLRLIGTPQAAALSNEYHWTAAQAASAGKATVFGAPIASAFSDPRNLVASIPGASATATHVVALVLIVLMVAATYTTQRQVMLRNTTTLDTQQAMIQKLMLYGVPASLTVSGFFFPIGVLFYWFTNNLWSMGQQFYILKRMPHPNAKKPGPDPEVAKALAPKPGQKPVRPTKRAALPADADQPADDTSDGTATKPAPGAKPAAGAKPAPGAKPAAGAKPPARAKPAPGAKAAPGRKTATGATPPRRAADGADAADGQVSGDGDAVVDGALTSDDGAAPVGGAGQATPNGSSPSGADSTDDSAPASPARPKPGPGARPGGGGGRRPQGQRSPTQTRQKKKRR